MLFRNISNLPINLSRFTRYSSRKRLPVVPGVTRHGELPIIVYPPALIISDRSGERSAWWLYDGRNGMIHHVWGEHDLPHGNVYYMTHNTDVPDAVLVGTLHRGIDLEKGELIYRNDSDYMVLFHLEDRTRFRVVRAREFGDWKDRYGYYSKNSLPLVLIPMRNRPDVHSLRVLAKLSRMVPIVEGGALYGTGSYFALETPFMTTFLEDMYSCTFRTPNMPTDEEISAKLDGLPFPWVIELDSSVQSQYGLYADFVDDRWLLHCRKGDSSYQTEIRYSLIQWYPGASVGFDDALDLVLGIVSRFGGSAFLLMDSVRAYLKYYSLGSSGIYPSLLAAWAPIDGEMHLVVPLFPPGSELITAWTKHCTRS